jgi:hypothetical protein
MYDKLNLKLQNEDLGSFTAGNHWIHNVLDRNNLIDIVTNGEKGDIDIIDAENKMSEFRTQRINKYIYIYVFIVYIFYLYNSLILVESLCREHSIGLNGMYNADQFGLLYKQYPNRVIIDKKERSTFRGVKAMKDKNRLSVMACANAIGEKVPLAVCGKHKRPLCFNLVEGQLPLPYTSQANSWYSQEVMKWWFKNVFKRYVQQKHGDDHIILILDNLDAHKALTDWGGVPKNIHIMFLPPNLTSKYQPMDQGVIATVKLGYKMLMLKFLLLICDDVETFEEYQNLEVPKGCRGLEHGSAPHILDALKLIQMLWEGDLQGRYSRRERLGHLPV